MICCPILFELIILPKTPSKVHLQNGQMVPIVFTRTVKFSPNIVLHNALYVPFFNVNLVSFSRLTTDNSIGLFFSSIKMYLAGSKQIEDDWAC